MDKLVAEKIEAMASEGDQVAALKIADCHLHDLRRTAATYLAKLGVDRVVISKILNHAEREVTAVYDRHRYDLEQRRALDIWGDRLAAIVDGTGGDNVVQLAAART